MDKLRSFALASVLTVAFVAGGATIANAATAPPDPGELAGEMAGTIGGGVFSAVTDALPGLIPWIVGFAILGAVVARFMPKKKKGPLPI